MWKAEPTEYSIFIMSDLNIGWNVYKYNNETSQFTNYRRTISRYKSGANLHKDETETHAASINPNRNVKSKPSFDHLRKQYFLF